MNIFIILTVATLIVAWLQLLIHKKSKNILLLLPTLFIYYWTIAGAWFITFDQLTGNSLANIGVHYYDYFDKLFPIELNGDYLKSVIFFFIFLISYQIALLFFLNKNIYKPLLNNKISISHKTLIFLSLGFALLSFIFIKQQMEEALGNHESFYIYLNHHGGRYFSLYQICKSCALFTAYSGVVIYLCGSDANFFCGNKLRFGLLIYFLLMFIVIFYTLVIGSRHDILFASMFGLFLYFYNARKIDFEKVFVIFISMVLSIFMIELTRGIPLIDFSSLNSGSSDVRKEIHLSWAQTFLSLLFSNEIFAGHMSMYGSLHYNIPLTYGSSFNHLLHSFIPRLIMPQRPDDIYHHYISIAKNPGIQGFTINHATGWYLNFGIAGVVAGGALLGLAVAYAKNIFYSDTKSKNAFVRCIQLTAFISIVAFIPVIIRTGPEGYKGLIMEGIFIPAFLLWISQAGFLRIKPSKPL
jgi:hypothetical protein